MPHDRAKARQERESKPDEVRGGFQTQFLQNSRAVGTNSFDAQRESRGNLLDGLSPCQHQQHLVLTISQGGMQWLIRIARDLQSQALRQRRTDIASPLRHLTERRNQHLWLAV